jgi:hypothetical protein
MHRLHIGLKFLLVFSAHIYTNIRLLLLLLLLLLLIKIVPVIAHCVKCYRIMPYIFRELNLHVVG